MDSPFLLHVEDLIGVCLFGGGFFVGFVGFFGGVFFSSGWFWAVGVGWCLQ